MFEGPGRRCGSDNGSCGAASPVKQAVPVGTQGEERLQTFLSMLRSPRWSPVSCQCPEGVGSSQDGAAPPAFEVRDALLSPEGKENMAATRPWRTSPSAGAEYGAGAVPFLIQAQESRAQPFPRPPQPGRGLIPHCLILGPF